MPDVVRAAAPVASRPEQRLQGPVAARLQAGVGNQAVLRHRHQAGAVQQPAQDRAVSVPESADEREADRVADHVMRMPAPDADRSARTPLAGSPSTGTVAIGTGVGVRAMVAAADRQATDVDPSVFSNRFEGHVLTGMPALVMPPPFAPPLELQLESLSTFTYHSFRDATQFFREVPCT